MKHIKNATVLILAITPFAICQEKRDRPSPYEGVRTGEITRVLFSGEYDLSLTKDQKKLVDEFRAELRTINESFLVVDRPVEEKREAYKQRQATTTPMILAFVDEVLRVAAEAG